MSPTLGERLVDYRRTHSMSTRRMALTLGLDHDAYLQLQGDAALPDAEGLLRVCELLGVLPVRVMPLLRASACQIMRDALATATGRPQAQAARQRGEVERLSEERLLVEGLPMPLRRGLGRKFGVDPKDGVQLASALRALAQEPPARQAMVVEGLTAGLELEGEEDWGLPPLEL
jgi:hypothetical protein